MAVLVTFIGPEAHGQARRDRRTIDGPELRLGRSTECEIHLPDARVALSHARIAVSATGATLTADGGTVEINGHSVTSAALHPGDRVTVGPYVIEVEPARQSVPLALSVQLDGGPVSRRSWRQRFRSRLPVSRRRLSWLAAGAILLLFLALPMAGRFADEQQAPGPEPFGARESALYVVGAVGARMAQSWDPGPVSRGHQAFGDDCRTCHGFPLVQVRDASCIACHKDITQHVPVRQLDGPRAAGLKDRRCAECHRDHKGHDMAPRAQELCTDCHRDIKAVATDARSGNVTDFAADHPRFRLTLLDAQDARAVHRVRQGEPMAEHSHLKFNHALHLEPGGVRDPDGKRDAKGMRNARGGRTVLKCADCHEASGRDGEMAPIAMDRHCRRCHSLAFEPKLTARQVPHGSREMATMLGEFYARLALRDAPPAPADAAQVARGRPGAELTYQDRQRVLQIAERRTQQALRELYETRDVCSTCHDVKRERSGWKVEPVRVSSRWMPGAYFSHASHKTEACTACHQVVRSKEAKDIAMPDIATCRRCHAGTRAVRNKVTSDCALCHRFHMTDEAWDPSLQPRLVHEAAR